MEATYKYAINIPTLILGVVMFVAQMCSDLRMDPEYFTNFEDLVVVVLSIQLISSSLRSIMD